MNDIYTKSLELMDDYLNSVSDQEFLDDYLEFEKHQGPLAKDFLIKDSINYTVISEPFNLEANNIESRHADSISVEIIQSNSYESSYASNDENYSYNLSLAA